MFRIPFGLFWKNTFLVLLFVLLESSCVNGSKEQKLTMNKEELIHALVQLATVKGILEVSDASKHDSLFKIYVKEVEKVTHKDYDEILKNLTILESMPDSLAVLQTMALDTLRALQKEMIEL